MIWLVLAHLLVGLVCSTLVVAWLTTSAVRRSHIEAKSTLDFDGDLFLITVIASGVWLLWPLGVFLLPSGVVKLVRWRKEVASKLLTEMTGSEVDLVKKGPQGDRTSTTSWGSV